MAALRLPRVKRFAFALSLSVCALGSFVGLARADDPDDWNMGFGGGWNSYIQVYQGPQLELASTQLERIADVLRLSEAQREQMMALFHGLEDEHLRAWVDFAESNGDLQGAMVGGKTDWQEVQKKQREVQEAYQREQERLVNVMLDDIQLLITPEQRERWDTIDRERRRMGTLTRYGCYPDERWDFVEVIGTLDLDDEEQQAFDPLVDRYAREMDPVLASRNRAIDKAGEAYARYTQAQQEMWTINWEDPEQQARAMEIQENVAALEREAKKAALDAKPLCKRVADLNRRYADEATRELDASDRREMEEMIKSGAKPQQQMFDAATYSRCRQKFAMALNMQEMIGAFQTFSASMGGNEWGIMRIARDMEPLTARQIRDIETLKDEFEAEMERLEPTRPGAEKEDETDAVKWSFTLRTPEGEISMNHNNPPEGAVRNNPQFAGGMGGMGDGGSEKMQAYLEKKAEIEQRYILMLREQLTLRQRALIALQ